MNNWLPLSIVLTACCATTLCAAPPLALVAEPDRVELSSAGQKLLFARTAAGDFAMTTLAWDGREWQTLFDAGRPLLDGPLFGGQPNRYAVVNASSDRKAVEFTGRRRGWACTSKRVHPTEAYLTA
jgi:hypothetical protein